MIALAGLVGLALGVGLLALLGPLDKSFDACVSREAKGRDQIDLPSIRRVCAKRFVTT